MKKKITSFISSSCMNIKWCIVQRLLDQNFGLVWNISTIFEWIASREDEPYWLLVIPDIYHLFSEMLQHLLDGKMCFRFQEDTFESAGPLTFSCHHWVDIYVKCSTTVGWIVLKVILVMNCNTFIHKISFSPIIQFMRMIHVRYVRPHTFQFSSW